jgi:hypothetical protein
VLVVTGTGASTAAPTEAHEIEADAEELLGALLGR